MNNPIRLNGAQRFTIGGRHVPRIDASRIRINGIEFDACPTVTGPPLVLVTAHIRVKSTRDAGMTPVYICDYSLPDPRDVARVARTLAVKLMEHEVEEQLRIDGVAMFDPHRELGPAWLSLEAERRRQLEERSGGNFGAGFNEAARI